MSREKKYPRRVKIVLFSAAVLGSLLWFFYSPAPENAVIVLNYHQINDDGRGPLTVSPANFAAELDYLVEHGYHAITAEAFIRYMKEGTPLPPKPVLITFDDGYADNYAQAFPLLKERRLPALIFIITDYIGTQPNYLTWDEIREMEKNGIGFGSHTLSHSILKSDSQKAIDYARFQLESSQSVFRWRFGRPAAALAYPCGSYDPTVKKIAAAAGFAAAFTIDYGAVNRGDDIYALKRVAIFGNMDNELGHFKRRLENRRLIAFLYGLRQKLTDHGLAPFARFVPVP